MYVWIPLQNVYIKYIENSKGLINNHFAEWSWWYISSVVRSIIHFVAFEYSSYLRFCSSEQRRNAEQTLCSPVVYTFVIKVLHNFCVKHSIYRSVVCYIMCHENVYRALCFLESIRVVWQAQWKYNERERIICEFIDGNGV